MKFREEVARRTSTKCFYSVPGATAPGAADITLIAIHMRIKQIFGFQDISASSYLCAIDRALAAARGQSGTAFFTFAILAPFCSSAFGSSSRVVGLGKTFFAFPQPPDEVCLFSCLTFSCNDSREFTDGQQEDVRQEDDQKGACARDYSPVFA